MVQLKQLLTNPMNTLLLKANKLRRTKLSLAYHIKGSEVEQPATQVISDCWEYSQQLKGFCWNINSVAEEYGINTL